MMSFSTVHLIGESLQDAIFVAVLVAILYGNVYQCFRLGRQMQHLEQLVRSLEKQVLSLKHSMDNIVLEVAQIQLKVEQLDRKLESEIDKVNAKLEDVVEEARMVYSRYQLTKTCSKAACE